MPPAADSLLNIIEALCQKCMDITPRLAFEASPVDCKGSYERVLFFLFIDSSALYALKIKSTCNDFSSVVGGNASSDIGECNI